MQGTRASRDLWRALLASLSRRLVASVAVGATASLLLLLAMPLRSRTHRGKSVARAAALIGVGVITTSCGFFGNECGSAPLAAAAPHWWGSSASQACWPGLTADGKTYGSLGDWVLTEAGAATATPGGQVEDPSGSGTVTSFTLGDIPAGELLLLPAAAPPGVPANRAFTFFVPLGAGVPTMPAAACSLIDVAAMNELPPECGASSPGVAA